MPSRTKYNIVSFVVVFMAIFIGIINFLEENMDFWKSVGFVLITCGLFAGVIWLIFLMENKFFPQKEKSPEYIVIPFNASDDSKEYKDSFYKAHRILVLDNTAKIERLCFSKCSNLEEIYFSNDETYIDDYAFAGCINLKKIELPKKIKVIKPYTFAFCESLENIVIPESVTDIGKYAFKGCKKLSLITVSFSNTQNTINENAFSGIPKNCVIKFNNEEKDTVKSAYENWGLTDNHKLQFDNEKSIKIKKLLKEKTEPKKS